jgi:pantothenate kinase type III
VGLEWGAGTALSGKGGVALAAGDTAEAERLLDEATAILRHAGPWFLTPVLCFRASLAVQRGNAPQAIACIRESLTYIRQLRDKYAFVYALLPLAAAAVLDADDEWAARILGARDAVIERTGSAVAVTFVNALQEQVERGVRERLGPDRWAAAYAAGRSMSIDMVIKDLNAVT